MASSGRHFLHTPGPTAIPERVLNAVHRQPLELTAPEIGAVVSRCFEGLANVYRTRGDAFAFVANGHGGSEAVLANIAAEGDRVLLPQTGYFSDCWGGACRALGIEPLVIPGDGRAAIDPDKVEQALRADVQGRLRAVLAVYTDTEGGVTSDIPATRAAIDAAGRPALLAVDAVASLAAIPFEMDAWGVDVALSASQEALMGPPGLAFVAANPKARAAAGPP